MSVSALSFSVASSDANESRREREQEFFDSLVRNQGSFNPFSDRGWQTIERRFVEFVQPLSGERLLDIGCGTGESRQLYVNHVGDYSGIDLSEASIKYARRQYPDSAWDVADACELPHPDASFDIVAFSSVLHHIDDYSQALVEAFRVLRPGGRVFAFDPNAFHPAMALFRNPNSPLYIAEGVSPNERPLRPHDLRSSFVAAGFDSVLQRCQSDIPYRAVAPRLINSVLSIYNFADCVWEAVGAGRRFGTFVITSGTRPSSEAQHHEK